MAAPSGKSKIRFHERAELLGGTLTAGPTDGGFRVDLPGREREEIRI